MGLPDLSNANEIVMSLYSTHIRYAGVGTMLVGSLWCLICLFKPIAQSISASINSLSQTKIKSGVDCVRTERDIPINYVMWGCGLLLIPIFIILVTYMVPDNSTVSHQFRTLICGFSALYILVGGFIFCSISAYFAGLIGSSNTPVSGLLVCALLILCLSLLAFFNIQGSIKGNELFGVILAVGSCVIISVGISISNDTMQDLKVGQLLGATPWKQQVMLMLGVAVSSFVVPPILDLLYNAYGIGGVFPRPGMNPAHMLAAPQAGLMATVAEGAYTYNLQWTMISIGAVIAVICIIIDETLQKYGTRLPVLAVGLAIYLPMSTTVPVVIGGVLSYLIQIRLNQKYKNQHGLYESKIGAHRHRGLLLACGIVAGASIMGVILAFPFAIKQSSDALKIMPEQYASMAGMLSIVVTIIWCGYFYRRVLRA